MPPGGVNPKMQGKKRGGGERVSGKRPGFDPDSTGPLLAGVCGLGMEEGWGGGEKEVTMKRPLPPNIIPGTGSQWGGGKEMCDT